MTPRQKYGAFFLVCGALLGIAAVTFIKSMMGVRYIGDVMPGSWGMVISDPVYFSIWAVAALLILIGAIKIFPSPSPK